MNKRALYESIMKSVAKQVKKTLNEEKMDISKYLEKRPKDVVVNEIVNNIKKYFKEHANNKVATVQFTYNMRGWGDRPFGYSCEARERAGECAKAYYLTVCNIEYTYEDFYVIDQIQKEVEKKLKLDSKNNYIIEYSPDRNYCISTISIINACKEFESIQKYLLKYANYKLNTNDCYIADTFGKRGVLDTELNKSYLAISQSHCKKFLEEIKAAKTGRDSLTIVKYNNEECDDLDYSRDYETECYGSKVVSIKAIVKSPTGRIKKEIIL